MLCIDRSARRLLPLARENFGGAWHSLYFRTMPFEAIVVDVVPGLALGWVPGGRSPGIQNQPPRPRSASSDRGRSVCAWLRRLPPFLLLTLPPHRLAFRARRIARGPWTRVAPLLLVFPAPPLRVVSCLISCTPPRAHSGRGGAQDRHRKARSKHDH
jgi:hypothetical protein